MGPRANSADDKLNSLFFLNFFFITKKTRFDISCNGDNLHEMQILFSWKNEKNISKCCLLKIVPRVLSVKVCTNKIAHESGKTYNKTCTKRQDQPAHSETAHQ